MDLKDFSIETENLLLVPISMKYAEDIFRVFTDEITKYMYPSTPTRIEDTEAFINSSIEKLETGESLTIAILKRDTGEHIGNGGITHITTATPELGIWIKKESHGHGYGKEAVTGLKKWADENLQYEYLLYPVAEENIASRKIPESLGGKEENKHAHTKQDGATLHIIDYHIYPRK